MKMIRKLKTLLFLSVIVLGCEKNDETIDHLSLLAGKDQKVWVISAYSQNGLDKCVSYCLKENGIYTFRRSGTVTLAQYNCSNLPCGPGSFS